MPEYLTPGVYVEEVQTGSKSIEGVSTSTAGFLGKTERGHDEPVLVTSQPEFHRKFGGFLEDSFLGYSIEGFFKNGGKRCFIGRITSNKASTASQELPVGNNNHLKLDALGAGSWGYRIYYKIEDASLSNKNANLFKLTLLYFASAPADLELGDSRLIIDVTDNNNRTNPKRKEPAIIEVFDNLLCDPNSGYYYKKFIEGISQLVIPFDDFYKSPAVFPGRPDNTTVDVFSFKWSDTITADQGHNLISFMKWKYSSLSWLTNTSPIKVDGTNKTITITDTSTTPPIKSLVITIDSTDSKATTTIDKQNQTFVVSKEGTGAGTTIRLSELTFSPFSDTKLLSFSWITPTSGVDTGLVNFLKANASSLSWLTNTSPIKVDGTNKTITITDTSTTPPIKSLVITSDVSEDKAKSEIDGVIIKFLIKKEGDDTFGLYPDRDGDDLSISDYKGLEIEVRHPYSNELIAVKSTGLLGFEKVDEISLVCGLGDEKIDQLSNEIIDHCEKLKDRFAILHTKSTDANNIEKLSPERESKYASINHPWIYVSDPYGNQKMIPPVGHIAGIYARSDEERGVHKAPANETVRGAISLQIQLTKDQQALLNPRGINVIRSFPGQGIKLWGARTISNDPDWKYVNVRRLFIFIEESIDEATQWVVFDNNNRALWSRIVSTITQFLTRLWRDGALMGLTAEEAFFVKCDSTTMTQDDIDNGRLIVMIGVAPVKPAEFVIFRITQYKFGSSVSE